MSNNLTIATGSVLDTASKRNQSLASAYLNVRLILLCDRSDSMTMSDAGESGHEVRYDVEDRIIAKLQREAPGQVLLAGFGDACEIHLNGILPRHAGCTNMLKALKKIREYVVGDICCVLISDGEPTDAEETEIISYVRQYFGGKLDTAFAGKADSPGAKFLAEVARAARGTSQANALTDILKLEQRLNHLLVAGAAQ